MTAYDPEATLRTRMKSAFIVTHDYGTGGVLYRLFADKKAEVERLFPSPSWNVFLEGSDGCPEVPPEFRIPESDIDEQEDWLVKHVWSEGQRKLGRRPFWFEHANQFKTRYFEVWAESERDVLIRFKNLNSMMLREINQDMMNSMIFCSLEDLDNHF